MRWCLVLSALALLVGTVAVSPPAPAQDSRPGVMVVDFAVAVGWSAASEVVTDRVVARLREDGSVRVLSRAQTLSALQRRGLDTRGMLDPRDAAQAASVAGADYVIMGEVEQFDQDHRTVCLPIVGCTYTVTASVRIRGVVVDAETGMVLARPDGQAQRSQGAASVWVGPWWTHVSVSNFDAQLIGRVTLEAVGQFVARAKPALRPKPGRTEAQPAPGAPELQRPSDTAQAPGGVQRPQLTFQRGSRVVLSEDFSGCSVRPAGWRVAGGSVECVRAGGSAWLAAVRGQVWAERDLAGFDPSRDFALEATFLIERRGGSDPWLRISLGHRDSPFRFEVTWQNDYRGFWAGKPLPDVVGPVPGAPRRLAVLRQGDTVHVFIDGQRALSDSVDSLSLGRSARQLTVGFGDVDIERQRYVLVSDLVVSHYD